MQHPAADLSLCYNFLQDLKSPRLQWADTTSGQEPQPSLFGGAIDDFDPIIRRGMIKRLALVLLQELVVFFPPWVIQEWEDFFSNGLQFFDADLLDSLLDRFAPGLSDTFNIEVFWFHKLIVGFEFL